jgi:hypothetical protein
LSLERTTIRSRFASSAARRIASTRHIYVWRPRHRRRRSTRRPWVSDAADCPTRPEVSGASWSGERPDG